MNLSEKLKSQLSHMFDFYDEYTLGDVVFPLYGKYYLRNSRYFAVKKVELYAVANYEHLFYYCVDGRLTNKRFNHLTDVLKDNVEALIAPNDEHMSSVITLLIECDSIEASLEHIVSKYKYKKSFKFGFHGWVDLKIMVVISPQRRAVENKMARGDVAKLKLLSDV